MKDPVEQTPEYKAIEAEMEALVQEQVGWAKGKLGYCHVYWAAKKRILKEKYNIDWKSPKELNPFIIFD